jgi:hypothetical protein
VDGGHDLTDTNVSMDMNVSLDSIVEQSAQEPSASDGGSSDSGSAGISPETMPERGCVCSDGTSCSSGLCEVKIGFSVDTVGCTATLRGYVDTLFGFSVTVDTNATFKRFGVKAGNPPGQWQFALYSDLNGHPDRLLTSTVVVTLHQDSGQLEEFPASEIALIPGTTLPTVFPATDASTIMSVSPAFNYYARITVPGA